MRSPALSMLTLAGAAQRARQTDENDSPEGAYQPLVAALLAAKTRRTCGTSRPERLPIRWHVMPGELGPVQGLDPRD